MVEINWSQDDSPEDDLCGKHGRHFVHIIHNDVNDTWSVSYNAYRVRDKNFSTKQDAKLWIEQINFDTLIFEYLIGKN